MEQAYLGLWAQVVLQAKADVEQEPFDSLLYNHAVSFFIGGGEWADSRAIVGECLDIPAENLRPAARSGSLLAALVKSCRQNLVLCLLQRVRLSGRHCPCSLRAQARTRVTGETDVRSANGLKTRLIRFG